jgi:quinol monooxygenase YgiN
MSPNLLLGLVRAGDTLTAGSDQSLPPAEADLPDGAREELLRGVHKPEMCALLLWVRGDAASATMTRIAERRLALTLGHAALETLEWSTYSARLELGEQGPSAVSNLVIRDIEPEALTQFLPALRLQMARVAALPGCQGVYLGEDERHPGTLLGITRWSDMASLQSYLEWPGAQEFKATVDPVTRQVLLRLLTQPFA